MWSRATAVIAAFIVAVGASLVAGQPASAIITHPPLTTTAFSTGEFASCAIHNGRPYCWGDGRLGAVGDGSTRIRTRPTPVYNRGVLAGRTIVAVAASKTKSCALDSAGRAYCWGRAPLGNGSTRGSLVPVRVTMPSAAGPHGFGQIQVQGHGRVCARSKDTGAWFCWGPGWLGDGGWSGIPRLRSLPGAPAGTPLRLLALSKAGLFSSACGVPADGEVYCANSSLAATMVTGLPDPSVARVVSLSVAEGSGCAVTSDGRGWCWVDNTLPTSPPALGDGQVYWGLPGQPVTPNAYEAVQVRATAKFTQIATQAGQACAVTTTHRIYCWGEGSNGELGGGVFGVRYWPKPIKAPTTMYFSRVEGGTSTFCARNTKAQQYCWGFNMEGELGRGSTVSSATPSAVRT